MGLEELPLARLRFELATLDEAETPAFKGDLLRMGLLWWLSEYWCAEEVRCRQGCRRPEVCLFGRLVEPRVDEGWSIGVRRLIGGDTPPPAYALWDMQERRRHFAVGSEWAFEATLVGELALRQLPALVAAVERGAERGLGRVRFRSRLLRVWGLPGAGEPILVAGPGEEGRAGAPGAEVPSVGGGSLALRNVHLRELRFGYGTGLAWADRVREGGPVRALGLRFLSPVKLKEQGEQVLQPDLGAIGRSLMRRLRIASEVHGAGEWPREAWGPLLDVAEGARLEHDETVRASYWRYSDRSGEHEVEGFVGQAWYAGADLGPLLAALWLGQWLQIGKGYVMGNGRYEIVQVAR